MNHASPIVPVVNHQPSRILVLLLLGVVILAPTLVAGESRPALAQISELRRFATTHCVDCNSGDKLKGGFDIADVLKDTTVAANPAAWHAVLERLAARDMPPEKHTKRPGEAEYATAEEWVRAQLTLHERIVADTTPRPLRRLNRDEYDHTIQAVFGLPGFTPADGFPPDDAYEGFTNIAEALNLSSVLVEEYLAASRRTAELALRDGLAPSAKLVSFRHKHPEYALTLRGYDPGGAMRNDWWIGDHLFAQAQLQLGTYTVRLKAVPRNLASRPGYVPHFQFRLGERLVHRQDQPIAEGEPMTVTFTMPVHVAGSVAIDLRWVNGFPDNNGLRAGDLVPGKDGKTREHRGIWDHLRQWTERTKTNPGEPYPFPYFENLALEVDGPHFPDGWPLSRFQRDNAAAIAARDAKAIAGWLLPRLYRRPVTQAEVGTFVAQVEEADKLVARDDAPKTGDRYLAALRHVLCQALMSPQVLFHIEPGPLGRTLNDHELAARLSYFLWSAPPDDTLRALADAGRLRAELASQTRRLIADPRSAAFIRRFTDEWLGRATLSTIMPEPSLFRRFDAHGLLRQDLADEPRAMMAHLLAANGSLFDLLDCDYAFLNDRLADHYHLPSLWSIVPFAQDGFTPVSGGELRRVTLPADRRGGLVTMAGCLALTSENTRTSPVRRGVWILEKLFNRRPPPPPPNVNGALPETVEADTAVAQLAKHRSAANCAGCHQRIDPYGVALEHYDVIGEWRAKEGVWIDPASPTRSVEATRARLKLGKYDPLPRYDIDDAFTIGGFSGRGANDLKRHLMEQRARFARGFSERLLSYALGRRHLLRDEHAIEQIIATAMKDELRFPALILALVQHPVFHTH